MSETLKKKVEKMNPRKGFVNLTLCMVVFAIVAGICVFGRFGTRLADAKQQIKEQGKMKIEQTMEERGDWERDGADIEDAKKQERHHESEDVEWEQLLKLTTGDYALIGAIAAIAWILFAIYWLYTTAYAVSKSWEVGANATLFGVLTLFTNLFGVLCLMVYIKLHAVCPECGKLQPWKAEFCALCGKPMVQKCPVCGRRVARKDNFCNACGAKIEQTEIK